MRGADLDTSSFFSRLRDQLSSAENETEVRDRFCSECYSHLGITFRLERGDSDAGPNRTILEFKGPGLFRGKTTSAKFCEAYHKLATKYIPEQAEEEHHHPSQYIGVAIDGRHYSFVFFEENGSVRHTALIPVDEAGLVPLLDALVRDTRRASDGDDNARVTFGSLGTKTATVELAAASLRPGRASPPGDWRVHAPAHWRAHANGGAAGLRRLVGGQGLLDVGDQALRPSDLLRRAVAVGLEVA